MNFSSINTISRNPILFARLYTYNIKSKMFQCSLSILSSKLTVPQVIVKCKINSGFTRYTKLFELSFVLDFFLNFFLFLRGEFHSFGINSKYALTGEEKNRLNTIKPRAFLSLIVSLCDVGTVPHTSTLKLIYDLIGSVLCWGEELLWTI